MVAFQQGSQINDPLAAALAAAAALARNGGTFLYDSPAAVSGASSDSRMKSSSPSTKCPSRSFLQVTGSTGNSSINSDCGDQDNDDDDDDDDNDDKGNHNNNDRTTGNEEDAKRRMARSRERNREHARRTRRRKKAQLEALQSKVQCLQGENKTLKQSLEECRIASILVGFSVSDGDDRDATIQSLLNEANKIEGKDIFKKLIGGKRTRFVSDADINSSGTGVTTSGVSGSNVSVPLKIEINGQITLIGSEGRSHLNWKTGVYTDDNGVRSLLTNQQLESLRRERNRIHAKMTRDRKKSFIAAIEKTIEELESSNKRMNAVLAEVTCSQKSLVRADILVSSPENKKIISNDFQVLPPPGVTPSSSPATIPRETLGYSVPELMTALAMPSSAKSTIHTVMGQMKHVRNNDHDVSAKELNLPPKKRVCHGFTLPY